MGLEACTRSSLLERWRPEPEEHTSSLQQNSYVCHSSSTSRALSFTLPLSLPLSLSFSLSLSLSRLQTTHSHTVGQFYYSYTTTPTLHYLHTTIKREIEERERGERESLLITPRKSNFQHHTHFTFTITTTITTTTRTTRTTTIAAVVVIVVVAKISQ